MRGAHFLCVTRSGRPRTPICAGHTRHGPIPSSSTPLERKPRSALRMTPQAQVRQLGAGQRVAPDPEAPGRPVADLVEARAEQTRGNRRRRALGDEVDFMHVPGKAVRRLHLEGAGREVVAQRSLAEGPGDHRPRRARFAEVCRDRSPVGPLQRGRDARQDREAERVDDEDPRRRRRRRGGRGAGWRRSRPRPAAAPGPASGCGRGRSPCPGRGRRARRAARPWPRRSPASARPHAARRAPRGRRPEPAPPASPAAAPPPAGRRSGRAMTSPVSPTAKVAPDLPEPVAEAAFADPLGVAERHLVDRQRRQREAGRDDDREPGQRRPPAAPEQPDRLQRDREDREVVGRQGKRRGDPPAGEIGAAAAVQRPDEVERGDRGEQRRTARSRGPPASTRAASG